MKIISHRGYWTDDIKKNSVEAFINSFSKGYGTETDVRDLHGELVISHDTPLGGEILFKDFLELYTSFNIKAPLAINIKSDGLAALIISQLNNYPGLNYVCFDMSVPDMRDYQKHQLSYLCRISEEETIPSFEKGAVGVWLDSFYGNWFTTEDIENLSNRFEHIYIVSAELHRRPYLEQWNVIKGLKNTDKIVLCTDVPEIARDFFEV